MRYILLVAVLLLLTHAALGQGTDAGYDRYLELTRLAATSFDSGQFGQASILAKELLSLTPRYQTDWNYGNAVHVGHLVLGRAALADGNLSRAEDELLASVSEQDLPYGMKMLAVDGVEAQRPKWKASPSMDSFGPDMTLAMELIVKGHSAAAIKYLRLCSRFWTNDSGKLNEWARVIKNGEVPDFGPNLRYFFTPLAR